MSRTETTAAQVDPERMPHGQMHPGRRLLVALLLTLFMVAVLAVVVPSASEAAGIAGPPAEEIVIPMAPADEGGGGLSQAGASEWIPFAVTLGPFLVIISGLLWLTFRVDAEEVDED